MKLTYADDGWQFVKPNGDPIRAAIYVHDDPAGIEPKRLSIYTDDGRGNGNIVAIFDLEDQT